MKVCLMKEQIIFDDLLNDVFYSFLLGLDGSANIEDGMQEAFKIYDGNNKLISKQGEIEIMH